MANRFTEIAFTENVKSVQQAQGSRRSYARWAAGADTNTELGDVERRFIAARDSLYMATVGETGWPYMQHRGGPPGFVRMLDDGTIGFADFRGNRQYVSVGNILGEQRVCLFFMDYTAPARLKLFGRAAITDDAETLRRLALPDYRARVERGIVIRVEAFDWNCPQHITRRYTEAELEEIITPLRRLLRQMEAAGSGLAAVGPAPAIASSASSPP